MTQRRKGHIINISSIGVLANSPRFSAYVASKAALDAFSRCAQGELSGKGISFTTINMPLVKTPMIAPTKMYDSVPTLTPDEAADLVVKGIIEKPSRIATRLGIFSALINALAPKAYEVVMNTAFELFPDSAAARGDKAALKGEAQPSKSDAAGCAGCIGMRRDARCRAAIAQRIECGQYDRVALKRTDFAAGGGCSCTREAASSVALQQRAQRGAGVGLVGTR
jgi:hypothetical protein